MKNSVVLRLAVAFFLFVSLFVGLIPSRHVQATPAANGCWYYRAPMPTPLRARAAVELGGKIYVIGGINADAERVADVDVYDPATNTWSSGPSLGYPRAWVVTAAVDGKIYAIGGHVPLDPSKPGGPFTKVNWIQAYTPGDPAWTTIPSGLYPRDDSAVGVVGDNIYVMAGYGADYLDINEIYNPISNTFTVTTSLPYELAMSSSGVIGPMIYVMGGLDGSGGTDHNLAYDTVNDVWTEVQDMPTAKSRATSGVVGGAIHVIGGYSTDSGWLDLVERYIPGTDSWSAMNWMPTRRGEVAGATLGDMIYVFGGRAAWDSHVTDATEVFDVYCSNNPPEKPSSPSPGWGHQNQPLNVTLSWVGGDLDGSATYDVYFGDDPTPPLVSEGQSGTTYDPPEDLDPDTLYYWRIVAIDNLGAVTSGDRWSFRTASLATMSKMANPTSVSEPGGMVEFTVDVTNDSGASITLQGLVDDVHGDLDGQGTCSVSQSINPAATYSCSFSAEVQGNADDTETDTVTATIDYGSTSTFDVFASATVTVTDVLPDVTVTKTATPDDVAEPSGSVEFAVGVTNNGEEPIVLDSLQDDVHGDVSNQGTCSVPQTIDPGNTYDCAFTATVSGSAGDSETDTVTATVHDDENNIAQASDSATVTISEAQPDIQVVIKPNVVSALPGETITYTYTVENLGNVSLDSVSANDDRLGAISLDATTLAPSAFATGVATYVVKESDWPGVLGNTVTASGTPPVGDVITDADTTTVRVGSTVFLPVISSE